MATELEQEGIAGGVGAVAGYAVAGPGGALIGAALGWLLGSLFDSGAAGGPPSNLDVTKLPHPLWNDPTSQTPQGYINAAGAGVAGAVAGAVATGDTSTVAQGHTISQTMGDPTIQGDGQYVVPDAATLNAWSAFVAGLQASGNNTSNAPTGAEEQQFINGISHGNWLAALQGMITYGVTSFVQSITGTPTPTPAEDAYATAIASAILTNNPQLAIAAEAVFNGTATRDQSNYVASHAMNGGEIEILTANYKIAAGLGSKQVYDPSAPGGYVTVGSSYGVKQAQTSSQNFQEAQAEGTTVGGGTLAQQKAIAAQQQAENDAFNFNPLEQASLNQD